jgi:hypothetical protein
MGDEQTSALDSLTAQEERELSRLLSLYTARRRFNYSELARLSVRLAASERAARKTWDDRDSAELTALLAEYESLRTESLNTVNNRVQILILGIAAIGAVAGGALAIDEPTKNAEIVTALFSGAIPMLCMFVLFVWVSEAMRSHRVGSFLAGDAEARVNAKLGRLTLTWEASLWAERQPRDEMFGPSMMALAVVGLLAGLAPPFGLFVIGGARHAFYGLLALAVPYTLLLGSACYVYRRMSRLRNDPVIRSKWPGEDEIASIQDSRGPSS